jgi:putative tricarboxylic transport membrane protein
MVPASSGGGWDQTAQSMRKTLLGSRLATHVDVVHSPGASGAIGLAQFVHGHKGDATSLLVGGLTLIGSAGAYRTSVSILDATPIARLTGDQQVVFVPAGSKVQSIGELVRAFRANPDAVTWIGGASGGHSHLSVEMIARALGIPPDRIKYIAFPDGREARSAMTVEQVGVAGYGELAGEFRAGRMRPLAIATDRHLPGLDVPTLVEVGINIVVANWRGVFAPPGIDAAERARLIAIIEQMVQQEAWRAALREQSWADLYLPGDGFADFVQAEHARLASLGEARPYARTFFQAIVPGTASPLQAAGILLLIVGGAGSLIWYQRETARRHEQELNAKLGAAQQEVQGLLAGLEKEIERQLHAWGLTPAEHEVALLLLKGLRHKEIAKLRQTSERTVRQQALAIYKKAGLEGRTDLAAFFLEDFLAPAAPPLRPHGA